METNRIIHSSATRTNNKKHQDKRPGVIILGDSHACGYAAELLHCVKQHFKVTGYVKPNAGLTELLNSVKEETSKLTKKKQLLCLVGLMTLRETCMEKNVTSIEKFLDATQHTNVILTDILLEI